MENLIEIEALFSPLKHGAASGGKATALSDAGASERENRAGMGFRLKGRKSGRNLFSLLLIPTTHAEVNEKRKKNTYTNEKLTTLIPRGCAG